MQIRRILRQRPGIEFLATGAVAGPEVGGADFGDNTPTSNQQNPVHAYSAPGTYVVTLTARNSIGTSSASNLVQITN